MAMAGVEVLLLLGFVLVPLTVVALVVLLVRAGRSTGRPLPATALAARRHAALTTVLGVLAGLVALGAGSRGAQSSSGLAIGLWTGLLPALAGLAFLLIHAIGEATWPRPAGEVRRASLERRTIRDLAPRLALTAAALWSGGLAIALLAFGTAADPTSRAVTVTFENSSSTAGPFPGWFYGGPLLAAAVLVLVATWGTLHLVASRPAVADAAPQWDLALRRLSAHRVLRGTQAVLGLTLVGVLGTAGTALHSAGGGSSVDGVAQVDGLATVTGTILMIAAVVVLLSTLVVGVVPGVRATLGAEAPRTRHAPTGLSQPPPSPAPSSPSGPAAP